ncbi:MAG: hypothetical protein KF805_08705 [Phycisphaeraceae bacterium]|nr:hypothetical protein [Phycisphaeraceae bacterium]
MSKTHVIVTTIAAGVAVGICSTSQAALISIGGLSSSSTEHLGLFTGSLNYTFQSGTTGLLQVTLTNTSPVAGGGFLTGFVFNIASADSQASATLTSASNSAFKNAPSQNAAPFGTFKAGAALGANWSGGGSPNGGIAVGSTANFTFTVSASDASALTSSSFAAASGGDDFAVRFKGFANGGSDKVLGAMVPAPGGAAALAFAGLLVARRRRTVG